MGGVTISGWMNGVGVTVSAEALGPERALAIRMFEIAIRDLKRGDDHYEKGMDIEGSDPADFLTRKTLYHELLDIDPDSLMDRMEQILDDG